MSRLITRAYYNAPMRLTPIQAAAIRRVVRQTAGEAARVFLFGSRLDDAARGGDVDLMVELPEPIDNPAVLSARLSARISRALDGRQVDVLLAAPNLRRYPIHDVAQRRGLPL